MTLKKFFFFYFWGVFSVLKKLPRSPLLPQSCLILRANVESSAVLGGAFSTR